MAKRKIFDYTIKELKELLQDLRKDQKDAKYWERVYARKERSAHLDADTRAEIKKSLKGIRSGITIRGKKIHSVSCAIMILQENNNYEYLTKKDSRYIFLTK